MRRAAGSRRSFVAPVAAKLVADRLHIEAKLPRGFSLVVSDALQRLQNEQTLSLSERRPGWKRERRFGAGRGCLEIRRQVPRFDPAASRDDDGSLDDVAQLSHVSWPRMRVEQRARRLANAFDVHLMLARKLSDEVLRQ